MNRKAMNEGYKPVIIGYQPVAFSQNVQGQGTPVSNFGAMVNIIPPKGGTGAVRLRAK